MSGLITLGETLALVREGRDLVEFHLPAGGSWQVTNLTNNVLGNPASNLPANRVFGAPAQVGGWA